MMMNKLFNVLVLHFLLYRGGGFFIFKKKIQPVAQLGGGRTNSSPPAYFAPSHRTLCGINHGNGNLEKKENISGEKKGFLYASLPPPFCQKQGNWKHRKQNPARLCTMHDTGLYSAGSEEKIAVDEAVF